MKKYLSIIVMAFVLIGLVGCSKGETAAPKSAIEKIKESGKIVMLTEATFPPFEYQDSGEGSVNGINGVDVEFGKLLASKLGVELEILDLNFETLITALNSGKGDFIAAGMSVNPERAEAVQFSETYYDNALYIIVPEGSDVKSLSDLEGKKIAVQQGTTGDEVAQGIKDANVLQFKGMVESGLAVSTGKADASIMDLLTASLIVKNQKGLKLVEEKLTSEETAMSTSKGSDLIDLINETIKEVKASGQLETWFTKHFEAVVLD